MKLVNEIKHNKTNNNNSSITVSLAMSFYWRYWLAVMHVPLIVSLIC